MDYYPFGSQRICAGVSCSAEKRYIGEYYDVDTALNYLNARYYDSSLGRFISEDSAFWNPEKFLMDPQQLNSYSYARNNPVVLIDPGGKAAVLFGAFFIPGAGEILAIGVVAVAGSYLLFEGTKVLVNKIKNNGWGDRYGGQVPEIDFTKFGLNQSPSGPEDWEPENLPNLPKWVKYVVGGLVTGGGILYEKYEKEKETNDSAKEFIEKSTETETKNTNQSSNSSQSKIQQNKNVLLKPTNTKTSDNLKVNY